MGLRPHLYHLATLALPPSPPSGLRVKLLPPHFLPCPPQPPLRPFKGPARKASQPFVEEKSSVIGELKNILEDGGSNGGTLGRSQGSSSGFKLPLPQEPMDTSNPQDPTVKRIVYNQYREMLKSYRTAQT